ncbi:DUF916 and DUF3324 domain-containing protein [Carnobacterium maltaromaticum]|uniref:DUF916 and DUF3324 domain-containing protein n=1 Tax=Carnobacterium maltaromaticum TaxID=2751 RepID=UPI00191B904A|nr:DUF916 and DUF3324 domain-containing protein [Carnobacterium maltaromaticum]CAD5900129.1 conserved exported hypothetical protein [Carnobacterium maltaromaticum]
MKKLVISIVMLLSIVGGFLTGYPQGVLANGANFSVNPILSDNQKTENISYFDFELLPKEKKTIEIEISNQQVTGKEMTYGIEVNTATTNINGVIDYTEKDRKQDESLQISFLDIVTVEPTVTVPRGETVRVPIQIEMPDETFEGILLGGITVTELDERSESEARQITNKFSYSIGIVLSQGDVSPPIELNLLGVTKSQMNSRTIISGTIQNSVASIVSNLEVDARIYRKNQDKPLFHRVETGMRMAPNSNFDFGVGTNDQPLKAGQYVMNIVATVGEQTWEWSEGFEITAKEAKELNDAAVALEIDHTSVYLWIAVGLVFALLIVIVLLVLHYRGGNRNEKKN